MPMPYQHGEIWDVCGDVVLLVSLSPGILLIANSIEIKILPRPSHIELFILRMTISNINSNTCLAAYIHTDWLITLTPRYVIGLLSEVMMQMLINTYLAIYDRCNVEQRASHFQIKYRAYQFDFSPAIQIRCKHGTDKPDKWPLEDNSFHYTVSTWHWGEMKWEG